MHAVHLLAVLLAVTLYLIAPHEADQQNQRNGDQDEMQRLRDELERTQRELVEQRLEALEGKMQQQNRELQSFRRKQKQILRRLNVVETTLSQRSHGSHQEEDIPHILPDQVLQRVESMDKQLAVLNDSHYQQEEIQLKRSEEVLQKLGTLEKQMAEQNKSETVTEVHSFGSKQCIVDADLYKALQMMKCKLGKTEADLRVNTEMVQQLQEQHDNVSVRMDETIIELTQMKYDEIRQLKRQLADIKNGEIRQLKRQVADVKSDEIRQLKRQVADIKNEKETMNDAVFIARGLGDYDDHHKVYSRGERMIYRNAVINPGSQYNTQTGEYTCPVTGTYYFTYSIYGDDIEDGYTHSHATASLYREGTWISRIYVINQNTEQIDVSLSRSDIIECSEGDKVWVQSRWNNNYIYGHRYYNSFSGMVIHIK